MIKTHCKRGHERIPENLYKGGACKICVAIRRGHQYRGRDKAHCKHGHLRTEENTYTNPRTGQISCRVCSRLWSMKNSPPKPLRPAEKRTRPVFDNERYRNGFTPAMLGMSEAEWRA